MSRTAPTPRWLAIAEVYRIMARDWADYCDFSDTAALAMFKGESGLGPRVLYTDRNADGLFNGYAVGKHWMDVTVAMWCVGLEDGTLLARELYDDPEIPDWWLDKALPMHRRRRVS